MVLLHKLAPDIAELDVESILSLEDKASPSTLMSIAYSDEKTKNEASSSEPESNVSDDSSLPTISSL